MDIYNKLNEKHEQNVARIKAAELEIGLNAKRLERKRQLAGQRAFRAANKAFNDAKKAETNLIKKNFSLQNKFVGNQTSVSIDDYLNIN